MKTGIGYQASLGLNIDISDRAQLIFEVIGQSLSLNKIVYEEKNSLVEKGTVINNIKDIDSKDETRNIIKYQPDGYKELISAGEVNTYVFPQDPVKINTVGIVLGLTFKF